MAKDTLMQKLYGTVEVDEAYIGGLSKWRKNRPDENGVFKKNKRDIGTEHQICIWGVVQRAENGKPKRAKVVVHTSKNLDYTELYKPMNEHVDISKSKLMSDGLIGYRKFKNLMPHEYSQHGSGWYVDPNNWNTHTNDIESLWRCIKSNINGCRHRVSAKHLQTNEVQR